MAERPLRVLRLSPVLDWREVAPPADGAVAVGGMAAQVARQTRATDALGVTQTVLALPAGTERAGRLGRAEVRAAGRDLPGVHRRNLSWLAAVLVALPRQVRRHDVVHVHASGIVEPLLAALAARALGRCPVVLTLHTSACVTYVPVSRRDRAVQVFTRAAERSAVRLAARTLVLTERVRGLLGRPRVEVLPDCVEAASSPPPQAPAGGPQVVLYVGRVSAEKGWPVLVELAARLRGRQAVVRVVGDGPDLPSLRDRAAAADLGDAMRFSGALPAAGVAEAMAAADVLVLPSVHEELGSVLLEAMAAGLPSVAFAVGGVSEAVVDGTTGLLVAPGDVDAFVAAVCHILDDPAVGERARRAGPPLARERHDVAASGERLAAVYAEVVACV